jgi:flagellar basal body-associated protein FliL
MTIKSFLISALTCLLVVSYLLTLWGSVKRDEHHNNNVKQCIKHYRVTDYTVVLGELYCNVGNKDNKIYQSIHYSKKYWENKRKTGDRKFKTYS